jgi:hypothetical protein
MNFTVSVIIIIIIIIIITIMKSSIDRDNNYCHHYVILRIRRLRN